MGFEKRILRLAEDHGVDGAYFFEGTMFFSPDNTTPLDFKNFCDAAAQEYIALQWHRAGDEIAVDFVFNSCTITL